MFKKLYKHTWIKFCLFCFPFFHAYDFVWSVDPPTNFPKIRLVVILGVLFCFLFSIVIVLSMFKKIEKIFSVIEGELFEEVAVNTAKKYSFGYTLNATEKYIYANRLIRRLEKIIKKEKKKVGSKRLARMHAKLCLVEKDIGKLYEEALILRLSGIE